MNIKRLNMDLGNSLTSSLICGDSLIELATAVVAVPSSKASDYFPYNVAKNDFRDSILLEHEGECFLVGKSAESILGNDNHINKLHDKSTSNISYMMFLATIAIHYIESSGADSEIYIDYLSTMLPIYELLQADKFSTKLNEMADRFKGKHVFKILTTGCEKELTVHVSESKCYAEGLTAKFALQYQFDLTPNPNAQQFIYNETINCDFGGGTIDLVRLQKGLKKPVDRTYFKTITEAPYLKMVKDLREEKLRKYFDSSRELEQFIVKNYKEDRFIWVDGNTGDQVDLTSIIEVSLRNYTYQVMEYILNAFPRLKDGESYKFNYFGGVAPILRKHINSYIENKFNREIQKQHHIESNDTSRFLNLFGLEIISKQNTLVK